MASVYVLSDGFCVERLVRFDLPSQSKALDRVDKGAREEVATVLAIPDDVEGTEEQFDPEDPPCEDDFSNMTEQVKHVRRWTAALDITYAQSTDKTKNKLIPMWYPTGAAVLLQLSALKYAVIGREAYTFEMQPRDEVVDFRVSMRSPDVLEPVAWVRGRKKCVSSHSIPTGIAGVWRPSRESPARCRRSAAARSAGSRRRMCVSLATAPAASPRLNNSSARS